MRKTAGLVSCTGRLMLGRRSDARRAARRDAERTWLSCCAMAARTTSEPEDRELQATAWELDELVQGQGEEGVRGRLGEALERAKAFAERYAGQLSAIDSDALRQAMQELAAIHELVGRASTYAALRFAVDTAAPANGALLQLAQERGTQIETTLLFFELEWAAL